MEKLYFNGDIITMEGEGDYAQAVLVAEGKIKATGAYDEVAAQKSDACQLVDLQGKTLMPSFIDAHGHATMTPMFASQCDLSGCNHFADIVTALKAYQAEHQIPAGKTIIGVNYDNNFLAEARHPHRDLLDQVSTEHPVVVVHVSVHMAVGNSLALKNLGFADDMADIPGGEIGRYEDGRLDGYLAEAAMYPLLGLAFGELQSQVVQLWPVAQQMYLSHGVTTVQDGASNADCLKMLTGFDQVGMVKLDVVAYPTFQAEAHKVAAENPELCKKYQGHVKIGGYKLVLDGSPQARTAWLSKPYENSDACGVQIIQDDEVKQYMKQALEDDMQTLVHCNGDAAGDQFLRCYEEMLSLSENPNKENLRFTMIHCQTMRKDQIEKMVQLKMIPSIFVAHVNYWGDVHLQNLGPVRGNYISPVKDAMDAGLVYNFHTDTPVTKPDMLHSVWSAVNRVSRKGVVVGADQRIGVYDALKAITINAAYEYFEENEKGSIKPGKRADLVILSDNPLKVDAMTIKDIQVLETIKDGETVYQMK